MGAGGGVVSRWASVVGWTVRSDSHLHANQKRSALVGGSLLRSLARTAPFESLARSRS